MRVKQSFMLYSYMVMILKWSRFDSSMTAGFDSYITHRQNLSKLLAPYTALVWGSCLVPKCEWEDSYMLKHGNQPISGPKQAEIMADMGSGNP